jgi:mono/diheme cytochrome c family protein
MSPQRFALLTVAALLAPISPAAAQDAAAGASGSTLSAGFKFSEHSGAALYAHVCQACHMPDGKGATGAGTYPALAGNDDLAAAGYPLSAVVNGLRGMPPIGEMMDDDQVAAVVNYVRTHFGNNYRDAVTAADVKAVRR